MNYVSIILNRPVCDKDTLLLSPAEMSKKKLRNRWVFRTSTKKVPLDLHADVQGSLQYFLMEVAQHNTYTVQIN